MKGVWARATILSKELLQIAVKRLDASLTEVQYLLKHRHRPSRPDIFLSLSVVIHFLITRVFP